MAFLRFSFLRVNDLNRSKKKMGSVSVVMPVYNQERFVAQSMRSILRQSYSDFEFIIVNDGSTDRTAEIIRQFQDERIRLIDAPHRGLIEALKLGISSSKRRWIARMDSDDLSEPTRLGAQLEFLEAHPECVFVTSFYGILTPNNYYLRPVRSSGWQYVSKDSISRSTLPFCDPGTVFDRELALEIGYDDEFRWEKSLWYGLLEKGKGAVLEDPLYLYRWRMGSYSRGQADRPIDMSFRLRRKYDPESVEPFKEVKRKERDFTALKRCAYYYSAAGDYKAAYRVILRACLEYPFDSGSLKLLLLPVRPSWKKELVGPAQVPLFRAGRVKELNNGQPYDRDSVSG